MTKTEKAIQYMETIARDDSHGYSQYNRDGNPDFDCSSLTIRAWREAGLKLPGATYTGNMDDKMLAEGFTNVTSKVNIATAAGLKRGDVLRRPGHVGMYCGNGLQVEASGSETGGIHGQPGDQTGWEISINQYNPNWTHVLRYTAEEEKKWLEKGDIGEDVAAMQRMLISLGYNCGSEGANGKFNTATQKALILFQKDYKLTADGKYGEKSESKLKSVYKSKVISKWKAKGTATCSNSSIYFRSTPSADNKSNLLGKVGKGQRFEVDGNNSGSWIHSKHATFGVGYIHRKYVVYDEPEKTPSWKAINTATCTANGINVRSSADSSSSSNIVGKLNKGQRFEVDGKTSNGFVHVKVAGIGIAWIHSKYVKYDNA